MPPASGMRPGNDSVAGFSRTCCSRTAVDDRAMAAVLALSVAASGVW